MANIDDASDIHWCKSASNEPPPNRPPRTVRELIAVRAQEQPDLPILGYPDQSNTYHEYTFLQLQHFSFRAASHYAKFLPVRSSTEDEERVVGLLGVSNLDYVTTTLALSHLGFTVLFLSTRLAEAAYLSLLNATGCQTIVVGSRFENMASMLQKCLTHLSIERIIDESIYNNGMVPSDPLPSPTEQDLEKETNRVSWIIHSSGSTGPPKPIYQTHHAALRNYENNMNMKGFITLPLFHSHGLSSVFRAFTSCNKIYMYSASLPLTRQNLLDILQRQQFEIFYGVPYALKLLAESSEGIHALAAMKVVMFGGSACPDALGNQLVEGGVNLISHYGTTETGQLMTSFRPPGDKAWNYVRVHEKLEPFVLWEERGANLFELVVLDGWPSKVASNRSDGSYATKDLFEPHPTIKGAWKYSARLDDTIALVNGEKAIPISMEQAVRRHDLVREVVVFGAGKSRLGMMVIVSESAKTMSPDQVLEALWPTIETENNVLPAYAQISRQTIQILPFDTSYPQTDKGTVIRQAFYRAFAGNIENLYHQLDSKATGTLILSSEELKAFLRSKILNIVPPADRPNDLSDDTDLFALGVDSLQSTQLREIIMRHIQLNGHSLPQNIVFENPTISKLSDQIIAIRDGMTPEKIDVVAEMEALIEKYGTFHRHIPKPRSSQNFVVIVTGATGSLGAHLVSQLLQRPDVDEVICLVRASSDEAALSRVRKSLAERKVDDNLTSGVRSKMTAYSSDFSKVDLGLDAKTFTLLTHKITHLIHSAWSVNFNKSLSSFEHDCIAGIRNLINFCLSADAPNPASFSFCSSVSSVVNSPISPVAEDLPPTLSSAQSMGYAQSKLVAEHLCSRATRLEGGLTSSRVLRIGQITADTRHGIWNMTEAVPIMLRSALIGSSSGDQPGILPRVDEQVRWLPVDIVAEAVIDISLAPPSPSHQCENPDLPPPPPERFQLFNLTNPQTFHWTNDFLPALLRCCNSLPDVSLSSVQTAPVDEWLDWLRHHRPLTDPATYLLPFWEEKYAHHHHHHQTPTTDPDPRQNGLSYVTDRAREYSPILRGVGLVIQNRGWMERFLRWMVG